MNEEVRGGIGKQHSEIESWKSTCDRLTASVSRKETEIHNLSDKCRDLENQVQSVLSKIAHKKLAKTV